MFEKCDRNERNDCATDEELQNWIRRKFLIVLENQTRFQNAAYETHEELHEGRIVRESRIKWVPIYSNLVMRTEIANYIRITDIFLQDMRFIHLDEAT